MALIKCKECGKDISDQAPACPFCGIPVVQKPVLIEQTDKKWKIVKINAFILIIAGGVMFFVAVADAGLNYNNPMLSLGFIIGFIGIIVGIVAKFGAWWHHK